MNILKEDFHLLGEFSSNDPAILFLYPGLNLRYNALFEMAEELHNKTGKSIAIFKHLPKRSLLEERDLLNKAYQILIGEFPTINIVNLGHSYGALLCLSLTKNVSQVRGNVLIAPAIKLNKTPSKFEFLISKLPKSFPIYSLNFSGYGIQHSLKAVRYSELIDLRNETMNDVIFDKDRTLIILSEKDSIICQKESERFFKSLNIPVKTYPYSKASTFHHLPLDKDNLTEMGFQQVTSDIADFINQL